MSTLTFQTTNTFELRTKPLLSHLTDYESYVANVTNLHIIRLSNHALSHIKSSTLGMTLEREACSQGYS